MFSVLLQPMDPDAIDCQTAMYCNHYPSWERKAYREGTLRRIAHTDFEVLTLLFQRQGKLPNAGTTQHAAPTCSMYAHEYGTL